MDEVSDTPEQRENRYASRKFLVTISVLVAVHVLLLFKLITGDHYVNALAFVLGAFMAGNVGEHFAQRGIGP